MRPLRLELEGFACFKDRQDPLEFADLDLFVISGPTGSGKSSLLDAMIFALFGRVPRTGKQGLAELISLGRDRMAVTLDFQLGTHAYRVARAAHRTRATRAMLEELRGELSSPLAEGVKHVDNEVQKLLGFDYDTFTRAVILPQGGFAAFLKSRPGEQQKILRDLLRLHVFEEMRRLAGEEQRRLKGRLESDERRLEEDYADATAENLAARRQETEKLERQLAGTVKAVGELRAKVEGRRRELARLRGLQEPREKARRRAEELEAKHKSQAAKLAELVAGREKLEAARRQVEEQLAAARSAVEAVGYDPELDRRLDGVRDAASRLADRRRALERQGLRAEELAGLLRRARDEAAAREAAEGSARERSKAAAELRREREEALRRAEHKNHVALLRRELAPGESCPVCEQEVRAPPPVGDLAELDALGEEVAAARRDEEEARLKLEAAHRGSAAARAEVEALGRQHEEADRRGTELAAEVGDAAGALQAEVGEKVRDEPGETVEERVISAVKRLARERVEHSAAVEKRSGLEKQLADAAQLGERLATETGSLERRQRELEREIAAAREEVADYDRRIRELEPADDLAELEEELRARAARESDERQRLGALAGALADLERRLERRGELERELVGLRDSHRRYHQLTQDLRSDRFEAYLLEKTFRQLVRGASVRLLELSQRYTLDFAGGGFRVLDHDNAMQPRSTDTLSGGETFLASLSLALELSEQIQRQAGAVSLDSIFIDEGFGTLDPETLETVTEAIESLPTGGRMVGIITHLPELTRRLPYRILIDKLPAGSRYRVEEG